MTETDNEPPPRTTAIRCPHCDHPQLVQIRATEVAVIYKCPNCGELVAPVNDDYR